MKKIILIGCPGSGKTTFANRLAELLGIPVYHLDRVMWLDNYQPIKYATFLEELRKILAKDEWILDGNFKHSIPDRIREADTILFFDVPKYVALWSIVKRAFQYRGTTRPDVGGNNKATLRWDLIKFIIMFDTRVIYAMLQNAPTTSRIVIVKRNRDLGKFLKEVSQKTQ